MGRKHRVQLTEQQRETLQRRIATGQHPARALTHARILLKADVGRGGPAWNDGAIARALDVSIATIERVRRCFARQGLEAAVQRKPPDRVYRRRLGPEQEAQLLALAGSTPPEGQARWSPRLLAQALVARRIVSSVSEETVRRALRPAQPSRG